MSTKEDIRVALENAGLKEISSGILSKCFATAKTLNLAPSAVADCWEAFSINKRVKALDDKVFELYKLELIKESGTAPTAPVKHSAVTNLPKRPPSVMITPAAKRHQSHLDSSSGKRRISLSPEPPAAAEPTSSAKKRPTFADQTNHGQTVTVYNPADLDALSARSLSKPRCVIDTDFATNVQQPYRHMFTVLDERAKQLDAMIEHKTHELSERFDFGGDQLAELEAVGIPRQDTVVNIGRICNQASEGRINATSILLEGSRTLSNGARVEVDLTDLKSKKQSYSLFPGQIVAVEGMNSSGRKLMAQRICEGAAHPPVQSTVSELMRFHHDDSHQGGAGLQMMVAAGPFTCSDNLNYEPFIELISTVKQTKPDVVILTGPFVDMGHKSVASGQTMLEFEGADGNMEQGLVSYEAFFANKIAALLEELYAEAGDSFHTQFVLVPSLDDATAEWVYPQAPFTDRRPGGVNLNIPGADVEVGSMGLHHVETVGRTGGPRRVHCVSNPCTLKINELVVGVTATDALFHISTDETNANLEPGSRLARISQHLLQQRSYYPLFPGSSNTNLNLKFMDQWMMPCAPDLLILPSKLAPFARAVLENEVVVVNPGKLSRDTLGGTYAVLDVHPMARETLESAGGDGVEMKHHIRDRTKVEIKRI